MSVKTNKKPLQKQPGWLNKTDMCVSLNISTQAFEKWGVASVARIGRQVFYTVAEVLQNRMRHEARKQDESTNQAEHDQKQELQKLKLDKLREEVRALELRNSVLEGRSLPAEGVTKVLAKILALTGTELDSLPLEIQRKFPDLDKRIIDKISEITIKHQNQIANIGEYIEDVISDVQEEAESRIH